MSRPDYVLYRPDKAASFGQAPRRRGVRRVWHDVQEFLSACADDLSTDRVELTAYRATEWDEGDAAERCLAQTEALFGSPGVDVPTGGALWPTGEPQKGGYKEWRFEADRVPELVEFMVQGEPWPKQTLGPVALRVSYSFAWADSLTVPPLPAWTHVPTAERSGMAVTLGRSCFIQPSLCIPVPPDDSRFAQVLEVLGSRLPFQLNVRHLRGAVRSADGARVKVVKLSSVPHGAS